MQRIADWKGNTTPLLALLATFFLSACADAVPRTTEAMVEDILAHQEDVTIVITDSGMGGLSVAADLAARLPESGVFRSARVVYYNAQFHAIGYNGLESEEEKALIFGEVLDAMMEQYQPDMLLIACNTLSVVYDNTEFAKSPPIPVVGIVEAGVDLIAEQFEKTPDATAIIFGTLTTIESGVHEDLLVAAGYPEDQIVGQAAHRLAGAIERGPDSEETMTYVRQFVGEALEKAGEPAGPLFGSFNCTHYGFARDQFAAAFAEAGYPDVELLDPNPTMSDFLFRPPYLHRHPHTQMSVEVVSKLEFTEERRNAIGPLLRAVSPAMADALHHYTFDPDLFQTSYQPQNQN